MRFRKGKQFKYLKTAVFIVHFLGWILLLDLTIKPKKKEFKDVTVRMEYSSNGPDYYLHLAETDVYGVDLSSDWLEASYHDATVYYSPIFKEFKFVELQGDRFEIYGENNSGIYLLGAFVPILLILTILWFSSAAPTMWYYFFTQVFLF